MHIFQHVRWVEFYQIRKRDEVAWHFTGAFQLINIRNISYNYSYLEVLERNQNIWKIEAGFEILCDRLLKKDLAEDIVRQVKAGLSAGGKISTPSETTLREVHSFKFRLLLKNTGRKIQSPF